MNPKRAILIRVGADTTDGGGEWLAPADPESGRFVYIPIIENTTEFHPGCERKFDEVADPLIRFLTEHRAPQHRWWRSRLQLKLGQAMHLDPDYEHLTYGDDGSIRGRDLRAFERDDLIVFYSSFKSIRPGDHLLYALVGVYVVDEVVASAPLVPSDRRHENAHTRKAALHPADIVVRARPGVSGRCERGIRIGEKRGVSNYYLLPEVDQAWGGLRKASGEPWRSPWLNMSGSPPLLGDPAGFCRWWEAQRVRLVRSNFAA